MSFMPLGGLHYRPSINKASFLFLFQPRTTLVSLLTQNNLNFTSQNNKQNHNIQQMERQHFVIKSQKKTQESLKHHCGAPTVPLEVLTATAPRSAMVPPWNRRRDGCIAAIVPSIINHHHVAPTVPPEVSHKPPQTKSLRHVHGGPTAPRFGTMPWLRTMSSGSRPQSLALLLCPTVIPMPPTKFLFPFWF